MMNLRPGEIIQGHTLVSEEGRIWKPGSTALLELLLPLGSWLVPGPLIQLNLGRPLLQVVNIKTLDQLLLDRR